VSNQFCFMSHASYQKSVSPSPSSFFIFYFLILFLYKNEKIECVNQLNWLLVVKVGSAVVCVAALVDWGHGKGMETERREGLQCFFFFCL
jgi:hypothetical protein